MGRAESFREIDPDRLHQLSSELLELAATLRAPEEKPQGGRGAFDVQVSATEVRALIRGRRVRSRLLGQDLFADPAWDIMLDLFAAGLEGAKVSISSSCIAANVPTTTALRWIKYLEERRLIVRRQDIKDGRRFFLELSSDAAQRVAETLSTARDMSSLPV